MHKISAVVLTKNEEIGIRRCLKALRFCSEIIVIDDNSIDQTRQISKQLGAKVYIHALNDDFAAQRNFALAKAKSEWVLFVDADETVTKQLSLEIREKIRNKNCAGYFIKRRDIWLGKELKHGEFGEVCLLRLAKKKSGKWVRSVHEHWLVEGATDTLKTPLMHYPHPNIYEFIKHINRYSLLHAKENRKEEKSVTFAHILIYPVGKFIKYYVFKKGYLDGTYGFVAAILMSFHSFLAWSTQWLEENH